GFEKLDGVVIVLLHARADRQDVRVEDYVGWIEADFFGQQTIGARANLDFAVGGDGLPFLVEGHHNNSCPGTLDKPGLRQGIRLAFLEADRVDDALALQTFQSRLDYRPS